MKYVLQHSFESIFLDGLLSKTADTASDFHLKRNALLIILIKMNFERFSSNKSCALDVQNGKFSKVFGKYLTS